MNEAKPKKKENTKIFKLRRFISDFVLYSAIMTPLSGIILYLYGAKLLNPHTKTFQIFLIASIMYSFVYIFDPKGKDRNYMNLFTFIIISTILILMSFYYYKYEHNQILKKTFFVIIIFYITIFINSSTLILFNKINSYLETLDSSTLKLILAAIPTIIGIIFGIFG